MQGYIIRNGAPSFDFSERSSAEGDAPFGRILQLSFEGKFLIQVMDYHYKTTASVSYHTREKLIELVCLDSIDGTNQETGAEDLLLTSGIYITMNQGIPGNLVFSPAAPVQGVRIVIHEKFYNRDLRSRFPEEPLCEKYLAAFNHRHRRDPAMQFIFWQIRKSMEANIDSELYYESKIMEILYVIAEEGKALCDTDAAAVMSQEDRHCVEQVNAAIRERYQDFPSVAELTRIQYRKQCLAQPVQKDFIH